jgi:hypothetical protein
MHNGDPQEVETAASSFLKSFYGPVRNSTQNGRNRRVTEEGNDTMVHNG